MRRINYRRSTAKQCIESIKSCKGSESGVSEVVGIMMLIGITVVIAGLLAAYASGTINMPAPAPEASLNVYTAGSGDSFSLVFEHIEGVPLKISDTEVVFFVNDKISRAAFSEISGTNDTLTIFSAGEKISTKDLENTAKLLNTDKASLSASINKLAALEVSVYDKPSGGMIFKKSIILENKR